MSSSMMWMERRTGSNMKIMWYVGGVLWLATGSLQVYLASYNKLWLIPAVLSFLAAALNALSGALT